MIFPGDLVKRGEFLSYTYRYDDVDYSDGMPAKTPMLRHVWSASIIWPEDKLGVVIFIARPDASTCLLMLPGVGIVWVPTRYLQRRQVMQEKVAEG